MWFIWQINLLLLLLLLLEFSSERAWSKCTVADWSHRWGQSATVHLLHALSELNSRRRRKRRRRRRRRRRGGCPPRTPLGELTTLPRPPSRLGRGTPPPKNPTPLGAFGASILVPSALAARHLRSLISSVYPPLFIAIHHWMTVFNLQ